MSFNKERRPRVAPDGVVATAPPHADALRQSLDVDEETSSMKQRRNHSLALWTNTLSGGVSKHSIEQRYITVGKVHALGRKKLKVTTAEFVLSSLSLLIMIVHVKLRLRDDLASDGDATTSLAVYDTLRALEVVLTVALVTLVGVHHRFHYRILDLIGSSRKRMAVAFAVFEVVIALLGVLPPGVEATVVIPPTHAADESDEPTIERHLDSCYCLLQLLRLFTICKGAVNLLIRHVKSPAVLGWQHSMHVPSSFRAKYVLTRYPLQAIGAVMLITWLSGSFLLHVLEPKYATSFWLAAYDCWILILDAPPQTPVGDPGKVVVMIASFLGALCVAVVTATLAAAAELAPEEAQLVRKLETIEEVRKRERCAAALMQATARFWLLQRSHAALDAAGDGRGSTGASRAGALAHCRRARAEAGTAFRHASRHVSRLTHVHTLGVLHTTLDVVKADQQKLAQKLDMVVRLLSETAHGMHQLQRRAQATAGDGE